MSVEGAPGQAHTPMTSGEMIKTGSQGLKDNLKRLGSAVGKGIRQEVGRPLESKCTSAMQSAMRSQAGLFARETKGMVAPHATSLAGKLGEVAREIGQYCLNKIGLKDEAERKLEHCQKRSEKLVEGLEAKLHPKEKELAAKEAEAEEMKAFYRDAGHEEPVVGGLNAFEIPSAKKKLEEKQAAARNGVAEAYADRAHKEFALRQLRDDNAPQSEIDKATQALDNAVEAHVVANDKWEKAVKNLGLLQDPALLKQKEARFEQLNSEIAPLASEVKLLRDQRKTVLQEGAKAQGKLMALKDARLELASNNRELRRALRDRDLAKNRQAIGKDQGELSKAEARLDLTKNDSAPAKVKKMVQEEREAKQKFDRALASYEQTINEISSQREISSEASLAWPDQARVIAGKLEKEAAEVKESAKKAIAEPASDFIEVQSEKKRLSDFNQFCDKKIEEEKAVSKKLDQEIDRMKNDVKAVFDGLDERSDELVALYNKFQEEPNLKNVLAFRDALKRQFEGNDPLAMFRDRTEQSYDDFNRVVLDKKLSQAAIREWTNNKAYGNDLFRHVQEGRKDFRKPDADSAAKARFENKKAEFERVVDIAGQKAGHEAWRARRQASP